MKPSDLSDLLGIPFSVEQIAAITAPLEPGVIIAGAGTGKTTVMAARVVWLVASAAVRPDEVLGLTFTRKAAAELGLRVRAALLRAGVVDADDVDAGGEPLVLTYDAFAGRLLADHGLRAGIEDDPSMLSGASRYRLAARVVSSTEAPLTHLSRLRPDSVTERLLTLDSEMQAHLVDASDLADACEAIGAELASAPPNRLGRPYLSMRTAEQALAERIELAGLTLEYQELKRELGLVEFADQMAMAAALARGVPAVGRAVRSQFRVVLLDEYQDTSAAQAQLLTSLFGGEEGRGHPVTAVGDPYQAIYGWRGAAASNILSFSDDFRRSDGAPAPRYALTVNRRSGPVILGAANDLAKALAADPLLAGDGVDHRLRAPEGTTPGEVRGAAFLTWLEEVAFVADDIVAAHEAGQVRSWSDAAVLVRRNSHIGDLYRALTARDVPVEIVGLGGLLSVPEVADVVATLRVLSDVTANGDALRLLTGPRWAIGASDLALLGRRVRELNRHAPRPVANASLSDDLERSLAQTDAADAGSLVEAVAAPGDLPYSAEARARFAEFAAEYSALSRHAAEPIVDLVRRVIDVTGLGTEVAVRDPAGPDQLAAFAAATAAYAQVDGEASLAGLLAYLDAERDHGIGLEVAVPSATDSVKLLTVHRAKGLEWDAVWLPALAATVFPTDRVTTNWLKNAAVLPAELRGDAAAVPQVGDLSDAAATAYAKALSAEARRAEDRLAYVAATRARHRVTVSTHAWTPELLRPRAPSDYFLTLIGHAEDAVEVPAPGPENPIGRLDVSVPWPAPLDPDAGRRRREAAALVTQALVGPHGDERELSSEEAATVAGWDALIERLTAERRPGRPVLLPDFLAVTALPGLRDGDPQLLEGWRRAMPRLRPDQARSGEAFHAWLERRFARPPLLDEGEEQPDAVPLDALKDAFEKGPFAHRVPLVTEQPFSLVLGRRVVRGRIDAVFADPEGYTVVDWKTGPARTADPLQLAAYRVAWAELAGVPLERVRAAFFEVASGTLVEPDDLADRPTLEKLVAGLA